MLSSAFWLRSIGAEVRKILRKSIEMARSAIPPINKLTGSDIGLPQFTPAGRACQTRKIHSIERKPTINKVTTQPGTCHIGNPDN